MVGKTQWQVCRTAVHIWLALRKQVVVTSLPPFYLSWKLSPRGGAVHTWWLLPPQPDLSGDTFMYTLGGGAAKVTMSNYHTAVIFCVVETLSNGNQKGEVRAIQERREGIVSLKPWG